MKQQLLIVIFSLICSASFVSAQTQCSIETYQKILNGLIDLNSLDDETKMCILNIHSVLSRSEAPNKSSDCEYAWDAAKSAADDVESYAKRLIRCVSSGGFDDDCYTEARRVRSSHQDYESAVSDVQSYCY